MKERSFDEMIAYFNRRVSEMDIAQDYKMELFGMVIALGYKHEKTAQRWIPVVDKLPKHFQPVLLCTSKKIIEVGYWDVCCDCWCKTSGDSVYFLPGEEVVAWMPLPDSYQREGDDG